MADENSLQKGNKGDTLKGPLFGQFTDQTQIFGSQQKSTQAEQTVNKENKPIVFGSAPLPLQSSDHSNKTRSALDSQQTTNQTSSSQTSDTAVTTDGKENKPSPFLFGTSQLQAFNVCKNVGSTKEETKPFFSSALQSLQLSDHSSKIHSVHDSPLGAQQSANQTSDTAVTTDGKENMPSSFVFGTPLPQASNACKHVGSTKEETKPLFGSPLQSLQLSDCSSKTRSAHDSPLGAQQSANQTSDTAVLTDRKENKTSPFVFGTPPTQASNASKNVGTTKEETKPFFSSALQSPQLSDYSNKARSAHDSPVGAQQVSSHHMSSLQSANQMPDTAVTTDGKENKTLPFVFGTSPLQASSTCKNAGITEDETKQSQNLFHTTSQTKTDQTFIKPATFSAPPNSSKTADTSMDQKFGTEIPSFGMFGNKSQTQGSSTWFSSAPQFQKEKPGPPNVPTTAASNGHPTETPSLLKDLLVFDGVPQSSFGASPLTVMENKPVFGGTATFTQSVMSSTGAFPPLSQIFTPQPGLRTPEGALKEHEPVSSSKSPLFTKSSWTPQSGWTYGVPPGPVTPKTTLQQENGLFFETPQHSHQSATEGHTPRRALDFSTGAQQAQTYMDIPTTLPQIIMPPVDNTRGLVQYDENLHQGQTFMAFPTATSQFIIPPLDDTRELVQYHDNHQGQTFMGQMSMGQTFMPFPTTTSQIITLPVDETQEPAQDEEALRQLQRERVKAELQQKIRSREQKLSEIRSQVKACKGSLDEEWLEIDTVFSDVIHIVEEARQRALQPLEDRKNKLKRESQILIKKIEEDIEKLENSLQEVDTADDDSDIEALSKLKIKDVKKLSVDTAFSFGSLQLTVSAMMEQTRQELEKLAALELHRAPAFAVDVDLDPTTAHQWLQVSKDRKKVQDGGQHQEQLPLAVGRFDMYGSILAANRFSLGRAYWEVQVGGKSGWDLGVASAKANRKGKLSLSPDSGYWAIVHFDGQSYAALTAPPVCLQLTEKPKKVGVFVDYEEGLVSFYNVTNQSHIYSFTKCSFVGRITPYFSPHLKQNGENSEPLVITPMKS